MSFKDIFKLSIPVLFGYIPLGIAFGVLAVSVGLKWWEVVFMSVIVYAGSGQFLLVGLISAGAGLVEIFIAVFLINLRHIFYTTTLLNEISKLKRKAYAIFALTDETFAVLKTLNVDDKNRDKIYFFLPFLNQIYWVFGSFLGVMVGESLEFDYSGIEFCLVALFVVLAIEIFKNDRNFKLLFLSILVGIFGLVVLPDKFMLVGSLGSGFALIILLRKWL